MVEGNWWGWWTSISNPEKVAIIFWRDGAVERHIPGKMSIIRYSSRVSHLVRCSRCIPRCLWGMHLPQKPLKQLTIPQLEAQAAVLASRLCKAIHEQLRMQFKETVFFTDSTTASAWIQSKMFQSIRLELSGRDSKQLRTLPMETYSKWAQHCRWRFPWFDSWRAIWKVEERTGISSTTKGGMATRHYNDPRRSRKGEQKNSDRRNSNSKYLYHRLQ